MIQQLNKGLSESSFIRRATLPKFSKFMNVYIIQKVLTLQLQFCPSSLEAQY